MPPENESTEGAESAETTEGTSDDALSAAIDGLEDRIAQRLEDKLEGRFDAVADRRVNAILKEMRTEDVSSGGEQPPVTPEAVLPPGDDRVRRSLLKSAIQNEILMSSGLEETERKMAQDLAFTLASGKMLGSADDEFEVAAGIVKTVNETLGKHREAYQGQLRAELEARGLKLDVDDGQPKKKSKTAGSEAKSAYDKGAARAQELADKEEERLNGIQAATAN